MIDRVKKLLYANETLLLHAMHEHSIIQDAYTVGIENGLSHAEIALLALPGLLEENRRLFAQAVVKIQEKV